MCGLRSTNILEMNNLTSKLGKYEDELNQEKLVKLWGDSLLRLTPRQRQLIVEILSNSRLTGFASQP